MCSSVVERCPDKTEVVGPIPTTPTVGRCALSSVVERLHDTQKVIGSIPVGRTNINFKNGFTKLQQFER